MRRFQVWTVVLCLLLLAVSCGRRYRLHPDDLSSEGRWECSRGSSARLGVAESAAFDGRLRLLWVQTTSGKPAGPLSIHNGTLIYPESKKKIRFYDVASGRHLGRLNAKGVPQTGVAVADSLAFYGVAPRKEFLRAVNLLTARRLWNADVKDANAGPIIVDNRLIVSSREGVLLAFELDDGELAWTFQADQRLTAGPSFGHDRLFQPADQGWLYAVSADSGCEMFRVRLDGPLVNAVAVADRVYGAVMTGQVYGLNPEDGSVVWQTQLDGPIWTSPAVAGESVFVGHSGGELAALDGATGRVLWRYDLGEVVRASALVLGEYVVAGTMTGRVLVLDAESGASVDSTRVKGAIQFPPVTDGRRLFIATQAGKIFCFGESNEQADRTHQGVNPQLQSE